LLYSFLLPKQICLKVVHMYKRKLAGKLRE
jgi:hypothetical protein